MQYKANPWFPALPMPSLASPLAWMGPFGNVQLVGDGIIRAVTLELPTEAVRGLLPYTLELAPQQMTKAGTHPVVMFFQEMLRAHMNIPSLLPNMTYHEYVLAVPHTRPKGGFGMGSRGALQFMPKLYLSEWLPTVGGLLFWGFAKEMAHYEVSESRIQIAPHGGGEPLVSLDYQPTGDYRPVGEYPNFAPLQQIMSQPLVSQLPAAMGPFLACSNYDKIWSQAVLRPISSKVTVNQAFVPNLPTGVFQDEGRSITSSVLGAVEIKAPWTLSVLYPIWLA
jgi:hypothetical protein